MDCVNPYRTRRFAEARAGLKDIAPAAVAAVPIGLLFGAMGVATGLSPADATLISPVARVDEWLRTAARPPIAVTWRSTIERALGRDAFSTGPAFSACPAEALAEAACPAEALAKAGAWAKAKAEATNLRW